MDKAAYDAKNGDQIAFWNGPGGAIWTQRQEVQDALLAPVSALLMTRACPAAGERAADIGCGCGATSRDLAARVGPHGHVLGMDVSQEMLARARALSPGASPVSFVEADATTHRLPPASFDLLFSRFGVMFFADPVRAFTNLRTGLRPGGRAVFSCWREPAVNPWAMTPLAAAYQHVPRLPVTGPDDPGLFSFSTPARVERVLTEAGFMSVQLEPHDLTFDLAQGGGLDAAVATALEFGPTSRAVRDQPGNVVDNVRASLRAALAPMVIGQTVPLKAAIWIVSARNA